MIVACQEKISLTMFQANTILQRLVLMIFGLVFQEQLSIVSMPHMQMHMG